MGESLVLDFLEERVENVNEALALVGVQGILNEFEVWLRNKGYIKKNEAEKEPPFNSF